MVPTLNRGDVVFWIPVSIKNVHVGDIVVYRSSIRDIYISHRVIEITRINGKIALVTKGDANKYPDQYGPHAVEKYVTQNNLIGKVVMIGNVPVKLPYVGLVYLYLSGFMANIAGYATLPLGIGALFAAGVFMVKDEDLDKKATLIIKNLNNISFFKLFITTFFVFLLIISSTLLFAYDEVNVAVGVGEHATGGTININIQEGRNATRSVWIQPHGFSPMKIVMFKEGSENIHVGKRIDYINPNELKEEKIIATGTENGTYNAKVYVFTSAFWLILPDGLIDYFYDYNPFLAAFILDAMAALLISILVSGVVFIAYLIGKLVHRYKDKKVLEVFIKTEILGIPVIRRHRKRINVYDIDRALVYFSIFSAFIALPLALFYQLFEGVILSATISAVVIYFYDHKIKSEFVFTSLYSTLILILLYTFVEVLIIGKMGVQILLYAIGISFVIYLIFIVPAILISLTTGYVMFKIEERKRPEIALESDF